MHNCFFITLRKPTWPSTSDTGLYVLDVKVSNRDEGRSSLIIFAVN